MVAPLDTPVHDYPKGLVPITLHCLCWDVVEWWTPWASHDLNPIHAEVFHMYLLLAFPHLRKE